MEINQYDLVVIGGGAAGYFTAIQAAELSYGAANVIILEKTSQTLTKVKISGGGRCNVTHSCFDPKQLTQYYPRGKKSLIGPFHHFQPSDMVSWLEQRGVELKTEADGRMFPASDNSQTIINCLTSAAREFGIELASSTEVLSIEKEDDLFTIETKNSAVFQTKHVVVATGGTRLRSSEKLPTALGHNMLPPVPSLFTFNIEDERLQDIAGVSVKHVQTSITGTTLSSEGPILITHWGLSGPAILKLSAWGARELADVDYHSELVVDWLPNGDISKVIENYRSKHGKKFVLKSSPVEEIPKRLWESLAIEAGVESTQTWSQLSKAQADLLIKEIHQGSYQTSGKSINKDEFVTCGGVPLTEVNPKNFESKKVSNIYFAGEVLDIDGITGGFNFQNAWTSAFLVSRDIAKKILEA